VRRRLALLVAATTSVVLLAFTLPLAVLIDRAATNAAVTSAGDRSQRIVPAVAAGSAEEIAQAVTTVSDPDYVVRVRLPSGDVIGRPLRTAAPPVDPELRATAVRTLDDGRVILDQPVVREDGTAVISTLMSEHVLDAGVWRAWAVLAVLALTLFGLALLVADRLARSMTRPVAELAATAERLGRGDLTARVEPDGPDEVREVGVALNRLAARISELLAHEREAVADLSHRLRTPVTALRLDVESLPGSDGRDRLTADVDELTRQIDALIREARRPVREGVEARCDATAVVAERVEFWTALAEEQGRVVALALPAGPSPVRAGSADLDAALDALLGNVLSHTPDGAGLAVSLGPGPDGSWLLEIDDEGPGFADSAVLERGDSRAGSTGLGLDIARRTAIASGGDLTLGRSPSRGARVTMRLGRPTGTA
jgi:signal transduction histidine kinase